MKEKLKLKNGNILYIVQDEVALNPRTEWDNLGHMVCWHRRYSLGDNAITGKDARSNFKPLFEDSTSMFCDIAEMTHPDDIDYEENPGALSEKDYTQMVIKTANEKAVILPLRLYDHSGITMSVGSGAHQFDPGGWDSGQVGWIFLTYAEARKELKVDENDMIEEWHGEKKGQKISLHDVIVRMLEGQVETYDQYLTGDVYGFQLKKIVKFEKKNLETGEVEIIEEEETLDSCYGFYGHDFKENGLYDHAGITQEDILEEVTI